MDDNHFLDNDMLNVQKERPSFLTVLTIITFIVSGLMLISSLYGLFTYDELEAQNQMEEIIVTYSKMGMDTETIDSIEMLFQEQAENYWLFSILGLLSIILSLGGAYLMYNMKKQGFHLYIISKLIGLVPLLFLTMSFIIAIGYGFVFIISLAFVIMYAVNLKHLKN